MAPGDPMPEAKHMTWEVDHEARVIRITVRLAVFRANGPKPSKKDVEDVENYAGDRWIGLYFACYRVDVIVKVRSISKPEQVKQDEVPVQIDYPQDSWVQVIFPEGRHPLGDRPADRVHPTMGFFNPQQQQAWSHELGHILGLDDGYDKDSGDSQVPGHPEDLMFDWESKTVSPETVARMVRRSGQVDESQMQCSLGFDATPSTVSVLILEVKDLTIRAWSCDWKPPSTNSSGPPVPIEFTGKLGLDAGYLHGSQNAGFREFLKAFGVDSDPLAPMYEAAVPVTFSIMPQGEGTMQIHAFNGVVIDGDYSWDAVQGVPVMKGPLRVNGVTSASFFPGPPMHGTFTKGAAECSQ